MSHPGREPLIVPHADVWALLDVIPDGVIALDSEWRCRYANDAVEKILGRSRESVTGRPVGEVFDTQSGTDVASRLQRATTEQQPESFDWVGPDRRVVTVQVLPQPNWVALVLRIHPGRRQTSCALDERMEARLLHAQKLEVVGRIAGVVAHDFNNLLTVIQSYSEFVAAELPAGSTARADIDEVMNAAKSAADLTRHLLAFSRKHFHQPRRLDVRVMVTRLASMWRRVLGEDVRIETDFAPESSAVLADPGLLEQVLMNLAVNARDAMPEGGTLYLRTSTLQIEAATSVSGRPLAPGAYVSIAVEDTGVGMASDVVDKIFDAFYTTKQEGTGLGLAIVLGIVEQLGGDVRVESAPGWGSCFTVLLPCVDVRSDAAAQVNSDAVPARSLPRGTEFILLVEDETSVRVAVRRMLERLGYTVQDAASGAESLSMAASLPTPPDLVLTDVIMPGLNGRAVAERMVERWPDIRVLFMSGYTHDELHRQGLLPADVQLLEKPITLELVGHAVRRTLDAAKAA